MELGDPFFILPIITVSDMICYVFYKKYEISYLYQNIFVIFMS